jgi:hypothetical protein
VFTTKEQLCKPLHFSSPLPAPILLLLYTFAPLTATRSHVLTALAFKDQLWSPISHFATPCCGSHMHNALVWASDLVFNPPPPFVFDLVTMVETLALGAVVEIVVRQLIAQQR